MLSLREVYREELLKLMQEDSRVVCLEADLGGCDNLIQSLFPQHYINVGIAEHTMINMAAGMAQEDLIPFASTFAAFAVLRACEAVKLSMGYMGLNIKLICPYSGVSGAWFGTTHHCLEDFAIISSFPGIAIGAPHGAEEMCAMIRWAYEYNGPVYLRLGRNAKLPDLYYLDPLIYPQSRRVSGWIENAMTVIVSVGEMGTHLAINVQSSLVQKGYLLNHLHLPFPDASGRAKAADILKMFQTVIVIEEHRSACGVGTMLQLLLPGVKVLSIGANEEWVSHGGSHEEILQSLGLSVSKILTQIRNIIDEGGL